MNEEERNKLTRAAALQIASWCGIERQKYVDAYYKHEEIVKLQKKMLSFVEELDSLSEKKIGETNDE